jgi:hypothetical protein
MKLCLRRPLSESGFGTKPPGQLNRACPPDTFHLGFPPEICFKLCEYAQHVEKGPTRGSAGIYRLLGGLSCVQLTPAPLGMSGHCAARAECPIFSPSFEGEEIIAPITLSGSTRESPSNRCGRGLKPAFMRSSESSICRHGLCTSLGSPPVSPVSAGCRAPGNPGQRRACQR